MLPHNVFLFLWTQLQLFVFLHQWLNMLVAIFIFEQIKKISTKSMTTSSLELVHHYKTAIIINC